MSSEVAAASAADVRPRSFVDRAGAGAAALTALFAAAALALAVTTPPRTGPFAAPGATLTYPYAGAARFVPRDFLWMYPALLMMLSFVVLAACVHARTSGERRLAGRLGLCLATVAFTVIAVDYFIQLQVVQPGLLAGEGAGLAALSQYNPHGVFIALENLGFLITGLAFPCVALALGESRRERVTRWILLAAGGVAVAMFMALWAAYGLDLDYRFEVGVIAVDWLGLIAAGTLLVPVFKRARGEHPA
jgi:hypothetical protein